MNVIFLDPGFPDNQRQFVRGLTEVGANVIGIGSTPKEALDDDLRHWLSHYEQLGNLTDEGELGHVVRRLQERISIDRLEATVEAHIMAAAHIREACGIPGTTARTAWLCRDKPAMKDALRDGGVPCAASLGTDSKAYARDFARETGYPLIVKPRSGAGASGTVRVGSDDELERAIEEAGLDHGGSVAIEEFVEGHEAIYDTITIEGRVVHDFISHYYPGVLEAMRTRWISPQFIATNRIDDSPLYEEVREMGRRVIEILGVWTSATHMEWFHGPKGLRFSEIGCRPPGVRAWDIYAAANEFDIYREWAMAVVHGRASQSLSRGYSAGIVALRPDRDGNIAGYEGLSEIQDTYREWILDCRLPDPGTPTQPVEAGYMANAWIRMRHPDYDHLRGMLDHVGRTVKVRAT